MRLLARTHMACVCCVVFRQNKSYLVLPQVDAELVDSVLAEVTGEHVARTRAVTERVRHGLRLV